MSEKIILIYSDLEGTILREEDGKFDEGEMHEFLAQIDRLQQQTNARVQIHLVSPIDETFMNMILKEMDREIRRYNQHITDPHQILVQGIESAAAYPMEDFSGMTFQGANYIGRIDKRIMQLEKPNDKKDANPAGFGKEKYVKGMTEYIKENPYQEILMSIYCGNGMNDLLAMNYIRAQKSGIIICPKNSRQKVKEMAHHVSEEEDLPGITDGIKWVNEQIRKRQACKPEEKLPNELEGEDR